MSNDRNDFEHEESEYHFTDDDDAGYEVESDTTKAAAAPVGRENVLARLTSSKRMLISIGVFLVLVFVAYKVVSPSTSTPPSTDIAAAPAQPMPTQAPAVTANAQQAQPQTMPQAMPQMPVTAPVAQTVPSAPVQTTGIPPQTSVVQSLPPQTSVISQPQIQQAAAPTAQPQQSYAQPTVQAPQTVAAMPVQDISADGTQAIQPLTPPQADANAIAANSDRAIAQMQADYQQKLNDYSIQNKAILDQLQALAAKVATIESQMNAMTQNIGRPNPLMSPSSSAAPITAPLPASSDDTTVQKVAYNVQAIIPGRAWLKSDNGDTVTVAEGDVVRDLGRISKIDPYDGIVEINTGRKVITLSYGNVG